MTSLKCTWHLPLRREANVNNFIIKALNYQRTAVKMELMCDQIKSMKNNEKMMQTFGNLSQAVSTQMNQVDTTKMAENLQMFNDKMD